MNEKDNGSERKNQQLVAIQHTVIPEIVQELEKAGVELEKWEEPINYPSDRNMI